MQLSETELFSTRLLDKSIEHYLAALETINRVTAPARFETFCSQLCAAWELMIKAKLVNDTGDATAINQGGGKTGRARTLPLSACIAKVFGETETDVNLNLSRFIEFRNEATHLYIKALPPDILHLFQTTVFNYADFIEYWHDVRLEGRLPYGFVNVINNIRTARWDFSDLDFDHDMVENELSFLEAFAIKITADLESLNHSTRYCIPVIHKLSLTSAENNPHITFADEHRQGLLAIPVESLALPSSRYRYKFAEVAKSVKSSVSTFSPSKLSDIIYAHDIKGERKFHFCDPDGGAVDLYNDEFVNWILRRIRTDRGFLEQAKAKRAEYLAEREKSREK